MGGIDVDYSFPYLTPASDQASRSMIGLQFEMRIRLMMSISQAFKLNILERVPHLSFQSKKSSSRDRKYCEQQTAANPKHTAYVSAASREMQIAYVKCINKIITISL